MSSQKAVRMNRPIKFRVLDGEANTKNPLDAVVSVGPSGLTVAIQGHGLKTMDDDCNEIIHLDYYDGVLTLVVWADINCEEPTHKIPLAGARLSERAHDPNEAAENVAVDRREKKASRGEKQKRKLPDAGAGDSNAPGRRVIRRRPRRGT